MLITVEELRQYITTDKTDKVLADMLEALELSIRESTNNNFQRIAYRQVATIKNGVLEVAAVPFRIGDTIQISNSPLNAGLYTIKEVKSKAFTVNEMLLDENNVLVTKIDYPADVRIGAIEIIRWKLSNENQNSTDTSKKIVMSETISRHSVTYAEDSTEKDIDTAFGVPKKYTDFLKHQRMARC